jgi:phage tail sheath protein FI
LYHPWPLGREEVQPDVVRRAPPDGAACGVLAMRARTRGAWVAPANEPLTGVVDLAPAVSPDRWLDLQSAQVNLFRQEARGFLALSADTLSEDDAVRPINVRRLLILIRRQALRLGADYVFEPNDATLARAVRQGFEALLGSLYVRGAFAGRTAAESFRVVTDATVNPPEGAELGRFVVELRVAPSLPLTSSPYAWSSPAARPR